MGILGHSATSSGDNGQEAASRSQQENIFCLEDIFSFRATPSYLLKLSLNGDGRNIREAVLLADDSQGLRRFIGGALEYGREYNELLRIVGHRLVVRFGPGETCFVDGICAENRGPLPEPRHYSENGPTRGRPMAPTTLHTRIERVRYEEPGKVYLAATTDRNLRLDVERSTPPFIDEAHSDDPSRLRLLLEGKNVKHVRTGRDGIAIVGWSSEYDYELFRRS